jgi:hypothetical protein
MLAATMGAGIGLAQDIAGFTNGYITFENPDTNLYYRVEFRPNLTGSEEWAAQLPLNIKSSDPEVTVPVGVVYRVAGSNAPFAGDATGNATADQVLAGATFSTAAGTGLTGTMPNRVGSFEAQNLMAFGTTLALRPQAGFYPGNVGDYVTFTDADFTAGNIRSGVNLFNVNGSVIEATGTAPDGYVLGGQTFSRAGAANRTGTMPNRAGLVAAQGQNVSGTTLWLRPQPGYYPGDVNDYVTWTDANFTAGNIRSGASIFGIAGSAIEAAGTAEDGHVLAGQTFSRAGAANRTGTMVNHGEVNYLPGTGGQFIQEGYHNGWGVVAGDADLVASNICSGVNVFGVVGTLKSAGVPKTGQTMSYRTGDDGDLEKGVASPSPRFTDHGNGTVTDNRNGLMWVKAPHTLSGNTNRQSWGNAVDFCNGLTHAGQSDWRLPNRFELESLLDLSCYAPTLPSGHPFTGVQSIYYWSSSTFAGFTAHAWFVDVGSGLVGNDDRASTLFVWPVRAGQ